MTRYTYILLLNFLCSSLWARSTIEVLHFNIKELSTKKLIDKKDPQVNAVRRILGTQNFDLLSINEIQYDLKNIPKVRFPGHKDGTHNMSRLLRRSGLEPTMFNYSFAQANTGNNAQTINKRGEYAGEGEKGARKYADLVNFGLFPGQYSTGLATKYKISDRVVIREIKWADWNPMLDFSKYNLGDGSLLPRDTELFDKNFVDSIVEVGKDKVHVITLHTVPAFNFGNKQSPNLERNHAQLEFLNWYLFGKCDFTAKSKVRRCETHVRPLAQNSIFIAMGDWNTDISSQDPGAMVLRKFQSNPKGKLLDFVNPAFDEINGKFDGTFLSSGIDLGALIQRLDYVFVSNHFTILESKVLSPKAKYKVHQCSDRRSVVEDFSTRIKIDPDRHGLVIRTRKKAKTFCFVSVNRDFWESRKASDHFPIFAKLSL